MEKLSIPESEDTFRRIRLDAERFGGSKTCFFLIGPKLFCRKTSECGTVFSSKMSKQCEKDTIRAYLEVLDSDDGEKNDNVRDGSFKLLVMNSRKVTFMSSQNMSIFGMS